MTNSEIISIIRAGGTPAICGRGFSQEEIDEIAQILEVRKDRIDDYFRMTIKTKLIK